ncbi:MULTISPECIES: diaminopimelate epimerase [unclassified Pseudomonas]|uniref:diaminopimelate epimerase n=1 Tax=unclassified Pseudomonas TaxID=196821 RepID=UPI000C86B92D|nr:MULTISPECIES: diaminopimelate epimerase [unclassified Pseudomonas]PMU16973.1 diaminopimelate epimerase [Pseudomonas sp. GP01-A9]PMU24227.1 diaminopimelate epimerase [Pseudomonas sp. GP01-A13]PMU33851.1 diaminopimelate epimerase [Pseudomonas sp. GP01-A8]PMU48773.1 diaminopimelate epimerase [Pseudomonas sp. GP01-A6]PMU49337.1 diaminopimelate epimerase [Pseudomonas sp. GP01-A14]
MTLQFVKMHAHGDDFIVIDRRGQDDPITAEIARRLGDRHRGIGFNQLAVVLDCTDAAARIKFWNPNGTPLDTCGSATRGVADMLMREAGTATLVLRTNRGLLTCVRKSAQRVSVDMGPPSLGWEAIPLAQAMDTERLPLEGNPAACSMGNPHCTFFVDDLATVDIAAVGPSLETHPLFSNKTNVHFVQVLDRGHIRLRIWERGGGIPQGSGSCCCGAVVNGIRRGLLDDTVDVQCDGGTVTVHWDGRGGVVLTGAVQTVVHGTVAAALMGGAMESAH